MKKSLHVAIVTCAIFSSCSNDITSKEPYENGAIEFSATIEKKEDIAAAPIRRTSLDPQTLDVNWATGDRINVNGAIYSTTSTTNTASFTLVTGQSPAQLNNGLYKAYYPSSLYSYGAVSLPFTQTYNASTNGTSNLPMYAESNTTALHFHNLCGVLAIKVASGTVKSISVIAESTPISGAFDVVNNSAVIKAPCSNQVTLDCGAGVMANNTTFYIAIPAITNANLQITVSNGTVDKVAQATNITINRNTIYNVNFPSAPTTKQEWQKYHAWVQFYDNDIKWATMNVGANKPEDYGNYYAWGETSTKTYYKFSTYKWGNSSTNTLTKYCTNSEEGRVDNKIVLENTNDAAYVNWGGTWRTPTISEINNLFNCSFTRTYINGVFGLKITRNVRDYSNIYIFLPAAGHHNDTPGATSSMLNIGSEGYYWTSTLGWQYNSCYTAYKFGFSTKSSSSGYHEREHGLSVRPVCP